MGITKELFGTLSDGRPVYLYTLQNTAGMKVKISEYGAAIVQLFAPDRNGCFSDVVCGYDSLASYEHGDGCQGAVVGRWANRIARGHFALDGKEYNLRINNGKNHLHGGQHNFVHKIWTSEIVEDGTTPTLRLSLFSPDGEEGFPGNLSVTVTYTLGENNGLQLHYQAVSDQKTVLNLTNHSYFNLGGYASGPIYNHELWVDANTYLETDDGLIPTGSQICVTGTPFDFTSPKPLGREIFAENRDLHYAGGYDHCFHFTGGESKAPMHRATLYCPATGREMKLLTNQPCVHVYTANFMINACYPLKGGLPQRRHHAICLETERMPDSMNHPGFTNCVLDVGQTYDYITEFRFDVRA
ncbi:MAG: galactose mutarotase [Clostridia bacterium]|nr:galactose mutarotase [Clostridia bacterium]